MFDINLKLSKRARDILSKKLDKFHKENADVANCEHKRQEVISYVALAIRHAYELGRTGIVVPCAIEKEEKEDG